MRAASVYRRRRNAASAPKSLKARQQAAASVHRRPWRACPHGAPRDVSGRQIQGVVDRRRRADRAEASPARQEQLHGKKNEVTSRHCDREKENDQGEGSLTIDDHSTTWGRRREFADVLAGSVAVLKLLPGLLLGVASSFSQPGILRPSSILAGVVVAEGATASSARSCYYTRARRKQDQRPERQHGRKTSSSELYARVERTKKMKEKRSLTMESTARSPATLRRCRIYRDVRTP